MVTGFVQMIGTAKAATISAQLNRSEAMAFTSDGVDSSRNSSFDTASDRRTASVMVGRLPIGLF